ncbi:hypothetical protein QNH20_23190 [Neobacillus sp. WH10]|uniref:hypothetical protein n=1 Tax=Neobacillus sp. WH10 TaxID=3047873 RepID=UPI0024C16571|nr:hypothetical protein [Neobacillus sp. WH10]WHY76960.1 hypothetical protein QNH20_23190 [Neobacillus sp. WH10]
MLTKEAVINLQQEEKERLAKAALGKKIYGKPSKPQKPSPRQSFAKSIRKS